MADAVNHLRVVCDRCGSVEHHSRDCDIAEIEIWASSDPNDRTVRLRFVEGGSGQTAHVKVRLTSVPRLVETLGKVAYVKQLQA